jgi:hypothetical protein
MKTVVVRSQQKWEHMAINRRSEAAMLEETNLAGQEGWELVSVLYYKDAKGEMAWTAFMKRPGGGAAAAEPGAPTAAAAARPAPAAPLAPAVKVQPGNPPGFDTAGDTFEIRPD